MSTTRRRQPLLVQLADLFMIEMTNWRWSWRSALILEIFAPLMSMIGLGIFARDSGREALAYVLTGNVVLALMFGNLDKVQGHFTFMRYMGTLDYFATLPIHRYALVIASVAAFLFLSLPSLAATIVFGSLVLGIPVTPSPLLVIVVPLCALPLAGIGALIAAYARTQQEAGSLSLLLTMLLLGLGPVIIPASRLPAIFLSLGRLSPATYAASALRQTLLGPVTRQIGVDLAVLAGLTVLIFWLVGRKLDFYRGVG